MLNLHESVQEEGKLVFKCKHCDNDDMRYIQFNSLNKQSQQYSNPIYYRQNLDYEVTPKVPIGIHIKCGKCGKDTFIIPNVYQGTMWGTDIPEQCITNITYEQPKFSAKKYIINNDGLLDIVVQTIGNELISVLSQETVNDVSNITEVTKEKYETLVRKGLPTVVTIKLKNLQLQGGKNESTNSTTNDFRGRQGKSNNEKMERNESRTETK